MLSSDEVVVDKWLSTCLDTGDIVSHGVKTGLGWVDLDNLFKLSLASFKFCFPILAHRFAFFEH